MRCSKRLKFKGKNLSYFTGGIILWFLVDVFIGNKKNTKLLQETTMIKKIKMRVNMFNLFFTTAK